MNEKPRLTQVRPDEEKALLDYQGDLLVPHLIHGDDDNWYADADELRAWRATRSRRRDKKFKDRPAHLFVVNDSLCKLCGLPINHPTHGDMKHG
jgi:hypothetical protein